MSEWVFRADRLDLSPVQRKPFASLALELSQYLAVTASVAETGGMTHYGFKDVEEVMDLCCAVSCSSPFNLFASRLTPT